MVLKRVSCLLSGSLWAWFYQGLDQKRGFSFSKKGAKSFWENILYFTGNSVLHLGVLWSSTEGGNAVCFVKRASEKKDHKNNKKQRSASLVECLQSLGIKRQFVLYFLNRQGGGERNAPSSFIYSCLCLTNKEAGGVYFEKTGAWAGV